MSDNANMADQPSAEPIIEPIADDQPALEALSEADPADAPDIAEGIAAGLQRELDQTGDRRTIQMENDS